MLNNSGCSEILYPNKIPLEENTEQKVYMNSIIIIRIM
jgi:hypothetical protein